MIAGPSQLDSFSARSAVTAVSLRSTRSPGWRSAGPSAPSRDRTNRPSANSCDDLPFVERDRRWTCTRESQAREILRKSFHSVNARAVSFSDCDRDWEGEAGMVKSWACCLYFTMPPPGRFVARRCIDPALKGPNRKAQGNALGIEGDLYESALKGRHRTCSAPSGRSRKRRVGTVPSLVPRALPGAFLFGPFRARNAEAGAQEDRREPQTRSRPTFHQPRARLRPSLFILSRLGWLGRSLALAW